MYLGEVLLVVVSLFILLLFFEDLFWFDIGDET